MHPTVTRPQSFTTERNASPPRARAKMTYPVLPVLTKRKRGAIPPRPTARAPVFRLAQRPRLCRLHVARRLASPGRLYRYRRRQAESPATLQALEEPEAAQAAPPAARGRGDPTPTVR